MFLTDDSEVRHSLIITLKMRGYDVDKVVSVEFRPMNINGIFMCKVRLLDGKEIHFPISVRRG